MAKDDASDPSIYLGNNIWNVAGGFCNVKILKPLVESDIYETIALFGTQSMEEDRLYDDNELKRRRKEGLLRLLISLKQIILNANFIIRKDDRYFIERLKKRIANVEQAYNHIFKLQKNSITKEETLLIDEDKFNKCLSVLQDIKMEINTPLNNAGLIFRTSDEIDLDKLQQDIIEGG